jgi:hypothetical protein
MSKKFNGSCGSQFVGSRTKIILKASRLLSHDQTVFNRYILHVSWFDENAKR